MTDAISIIRRAVTLARTAETSRGFSSRDGVSPLVTTGGSASTVEDTAGLPPVGASARLLDDHWLWLPEAEAADQRRVVTGYDPQTRTLTHPGPDYSLSTVSDLTTGTPYMVLKDDPDTWVAAVSEALRERLSEATSSPLTIIPGQVTYTLSEPGLTRASQVSAVEWARAGEAADEARWSPWADGYRTWKTYSEGPLVILDFEDPNRLPDESLQLRIRYTRQFGVPGEEWDVDETWAAYATLSVMADWLGDPDNPSDEWNVIGRRNAAQYTGQRRRVLGEDAFRRVTRTSQQTGIYGVRGRGRRW